MPIVYYMSFILFVGLIAILSVRNKWIKGLVGIVMFGFVITIGVVLGNPRPIEYDLTDQSGKKVYGVYFDESTSRWYVMAVDPGTKKPILLSLPFSDSGSMRMNLEAISKYGIEGSLTLDTSAPRESQAIIYIDNEPPKED